MEILVIWTVVAIVAAIVAGNKGRSGAGWFFLCLLLTPLALLRRQQMGWQALAHTAFHLHSNKPSGSGGALMKTLIGMLIVVSALVTQARADTMEQFRATVMSAMLHSCMADEFPLLRSFHGAPELCACWAGKLAEPLTMSEAVSMTNGIMPPSVVERETSAAVACVGQ
jgi:hypothetical protein